MRLLPREEWGRLDGFDIAGFVGLVPPDAARVVVMEDAGRIVGVWGAFRVVMLEGVYVAPEYRRHAHAMKALRDLTLAQARRWGALWAYTGAASDAVRRLIRRLGGARVPMDTYVVPVE